MGAVFLMSQLLFEKVIGAKHCYVGVVIYARADEGEVNE